jgi:hypothetical protein
MGSPVGLNALFGMYLRFSKMSKTEQELSRQQEPQCSVLLPHRETFKLRDAQ